MLDLSAGHVGQTRELERTIGRRHDHQTVAEQIAPLGGHALFGEVIRPAFVRREKQVSAGPLLDLSSQRGRGAGVARHRRAGLGLEVAANLFERFLGADGREDGDGLRFWLGTTRQAEQDAESGEGARHGA